mmetsp:Transcript_90676/g.189572  ORF Transcript_90676/g.189572 Transcript_90676/m.189572 type:complete len:161 (+) Transcript_90676:123-605(+)|eukprot:CAMPEP_0206471380 /NCGR_PEP_ID=MMETSP0324_2-20121206/31527_1 /ASSEMBLY_ACC=CAM_ASM_000836 /TAXON_ID=2866 /ORGANISM="Crypthecodinium cohnii, Strain Seligo" /LENGTH=160 /DNA_ID=CAMNT_0053945691 /DNA_START=82 /DNA_END=564 /DNA_ORIENTATION=+
MKLEFPEGYALCFIPLAASWVLNFCLTLLVVRARHKYDVQYPALYAPPGHKDEIAFNCVQRTHQNTLESWAMVMITMLFCGLVFPITSAISGMLWVFGRFVYMFYALGNPAFRGPGSIIAHFGDWTLMGMVIRIAYKVATDPTYISLMKGFLKTHTGVEL